MNKEKMSGDYQRTRDVILSCQNMDQLKVGIKMFNQLNRLHELPEKDLDKLENLIGLMRMKCKNDYSYDLSKKVDEEKSSTYKDFKNAAQTSGVNALRGIVFSEEENFEGGKADDMSIKDLSDKHNVSEKDIVEINKDVIVKLYRELWMRRQMWLTGINL